MSENKNYTEQDLEDSLRKSFVERGFRSIQVDGQVARNPFLRGGINYGIDKGWLRQGEYIEEPQYTAQTYVLTDEGKKHFGLGN
jgi:hypothetical protein